MVVDCGIFSTVVNPADVVLTDIVDSDSEIVVEIGNDSTVVDPAEVVTTSAWLSPCLELL